MMSNAYVITLYPDYVKTNDIHAHGHYATRARLTKQAHEAVWVAVMEAGRLDQPFERPVEIVYHWWMRTRHRRDLDGVYTKAYTDGLVACGIITDDSWQYVHFTGVRFRGIDRDNPRIEVVIKEIADAE